MTRSCSSEAGGLRHKPDSVGPVLRSGGGTWGAWGGLGRETSLSRRSIGPDESVRRSGPRRASPQNGVAGGPTFRVYGRSRGGADLSLESAGVARREGADNNRRKA